MTDRLFGTDGVRGIANTELTPNMAFRLGQAAAMYLGEGIVVGKDTRRSGDMLEAALVAGITSAGGDVFAAGIIPTPAVALLTRNMEAAGGAVISASHNPPQYNGIKFFNEEGFKLSADQEDEIEAFLHGKEEAPCPAGRALGQVFQVDDAMTVYTDNALDSIDPDIDLSYLTIAVDCGHGASSITTVEALKALGAQVYSINDDFDGDIINVDCGSTHLGPLTKLVAEVGADIGLAHDGDADRLLAVDETGTELDGDFIEAICALDLHERGLLAGNTVVSTVMCNLGFVKAMEANDIKVLQTQVGDKHVLEAMRENGYVLGGEQSGHTIFLDYNSTGDGLITALQLLSVMARSGKKLSELAEVMERYPQKLINVEVAHKEALAESEAIAAAVATAEAALADQGRVLVRASGTEPLIRVMVEARELSLAEETALTLAGIVESALN